MTENRGVSHALLLTPSEAALSEAGPELDLLRPTTTALRGRVALANSDRIVFATANIAAILVEAIGSGRDESTHFRWRLTGVEPTPARFSLAGRLIGPIWARLSTVERAAVAGENAANEAEQAEAADLTTAGPPDEPVIEYGPAQADGPSLAADGSDAAQPHESGDLVHSEADEVGEAEFTLEPLDAPEAPTDDPQVLEFDVNGAPHSEPEALDEALSPPENGTPAAMEEGELGRIEAARERAMAFIPEQHIDEDAARSLLIELRETEIKRSFPRAKATAGILRKTLLDRLIDEAVETEDDFEKIIPKDVRAATDADQIAAYLPAIVQILAKIR